MKKRSLFVATAMLLVAVLVATGATYAWFQGIDKATTKIEMGVANGESLEISIDGGATWHTSITKNDLANWLDFSTTNVAKEGDTENATVAFPNKFYSDVYGDTNAINTITAYDDSEKPTALPVMFKSSAAGEVKISGLLSTTGVNGLLDTLRLGVDGDNDYIFANNAYTYNKAVYGKEVAKADGTQNALKLDNTTKATIATLAKSATNLEDTYYYANATLYFWVEGPLCDNTMSTATTKAGADLIFTTK